MFYFRADANEIIATGHIMRCLTIAKCLDRLGEQSTFITADHKAEHLIQSAGYRTICIGSQWNKLDTELDKMISLIRAERIGSLLVDSYYASAFYLSELSSHCNVSLMDDYGELTYQVKTLINYNIYSENLGYRTKYQEAETRLLIGCSYVPLRDEFSRAGSFQVNEEVRNVLITTGGADEYNVAYQLLSHIREEHLFEGIRFHVICGSMNKHINELMVLEKQYPQIKLYQNYNKIAELMKSCDIGISAGGTTLYELCACGLPSICICTADNQKLAVESFTSQNIMLYAGDVREEEDGLSDSIKKICNHVAFLADNPVLRLEKSARMKQLVDGEGAMRLAKELAAE